MDLSIIAAVALSVAGAAGAFFKDQIVQIGAGIVTGVHILRLLFKTTCQYMPAGLKKVTYFLDRQEIFG